jgi:hypothetical protein
MGLESGRRIQPLVAAAVLVVAAVALCWLSTSWALQTAGGVSVEVGGPGEDPTTYHTEFIEPWLYVLAALVGTLLVSLAAWLRWQVALAGVAGVAAVLVWGGAVCVGRYQTSGWSDGLEVFIYVVPLGATVLSSLAVVLGWARRR